MSNSTVKSAITISLVPEAKGGPFVYWDGLEDGIKNAAALGYDAVEIFVPSADALPIEETKALLNKYDIAISSIGTGAGWVLNGWSLTAASQADREHGKAFVKTIIDRAAVFGAAAIIGSMQGRSGNGVSREQAIAYLAEALDELGSYAKQSGQPLIYEPLNRYETDLLNTVGDGVELLEGLETDNVVLLADLFHMNIEEVDSAAAIRAAGKHIGHIHFVDSNRNPASYGHIDFAPIAKALREIKFSGVIAAEARPYPDSRTAAATTIAAFRKYFA